MPFKNKEERFQYNKKYYQEHKKKIRQWKREWYQENKGTIVKQQQIYKKTVFIKRKKEAVQLLGGKCLKCGYKKCLAVLEFHHKKKEEKEYTIGSMIRYGKSWELIKKELKKCILLCANCHRELHCKERIKNT